MSILTYKLRTKHYNGVRGMIFLNFTDPETNQLGCRFNCSFCCWRKNNFNKRLVPTNEELTEFVQEYYHKHVYDNMVIDMHLTGGGDPLYRYEDLNKTELLRIIRCLKDLGCTVSIVTQEWEIVAKYWDNELSDVDTWIFSCEYMSEKLKNLATTIIKAGKYIRITKIFNHTADPKDINWENIKSYIKFYKGLPVFFRVNFNYNWDEIFCDIRDQLYQLKGQEEYGTTFYLRPDFKVHLGLYQNEVWNSKDFDEAVRNGRMK